MEFRGFFFRRLFLVIPVLFGVSLLIFAVLQLFSPVERASLYITNPHQFGNIAEVITKYGLDQQTAPI